MAEVNRTRRVKSGGSAARVEMRYHRVTQGETTRTNAAITAVLLWGPTQEKGGFRPGRSTIQL